MATFNSYVTVLLDRQACLLKTLIAKGSDVIE